MPESNGSQGVAINQGDDSIYVANVFFSTLTVVDGRSGLLTDDTLVVGVTPQGVAVDEQDDTVYVANLNSNNLSVIHGSPMALVGTIPTAGPRGVAIDDQDDTVYVTNSVSNTVSVINGRTRTVDDSIPAAGGPFGVAVDHGDDSVYVTQGSGTVLAFSGRTLSGVTAIPVGFGPRGVAVDQQDDTVYVTDSGSNTVSVINGRTGTVQATIPVGLSPQSVAVDQQDDTVYVTNSTSNTVSVINGRTRTVEATINVNLQPLGAVVDNVGPDPGLVYVTSSFDATLSVIGRVSPSLATTSGDPGTPVTINVDVPQVAYEVDPATVQSVSFGDDTLTPTALAGDTWRVTAPVGTPGSSVVVNVTFRGGLTASAGTFTYNAAPPPPAVPPSAPLSVTATPGDRQATVTWSAPASSGSFPVTNFEVRSNPAGGTCLVSALTCKITGLTNDTAYTFEARALNGAGWGPWSTPSNTVTPTAPPRPSISITGSRGTGAERRVVFVTGTSTGLDGEQVRAHVKLRGQAAYRPGRFVDVTNEGGFAWQRTTGKKTYVYFTGGGVQSKRVIIPAVAG